MSGVLKSLGKIFISPISAIIGGKVGKIIRKVAIGALAVGAVVLTGGAALGILPSLGTMVGSLGLSAGLSAALTGAISSGAVGALGGLVTGGFKGMEKGLLIGAATGGVMGGLGLMGPNGLIGGGKAAASGIGSAAGAGGGLVQTSGLAQALANPIPAISAELPGAPAAFGFGSAGATASGALADAAGVVAPAAAGAASAVPSVANAVTSAVTAAPAASATGATGATGGVLGFLNKNPLLASQLLSGVSSSLAPNQFQQQANASTGASQEQSYFAYGGGDANGKTKGGYVPGVYSSQGGSAFGTPNYGTPPPVQAGRFFQPRTTRWVWNPQTSSVEEVPA